MELQLPKGMRDFEPEDKLLRNQIIHSLRTTFERFGFDPLDTPTLERWDVLSAKSGASDEADVMKEVYRLKDQGERELGLRYDLTVPTARYVGMHPELKMPFKRYQFGKVFRDGPIKLGRYREFMQCDFDVFGCKKMTADAEIINVFLKAFADMDLDVTIQVNNRKFLSALIQSAGVVEDKAESAIITLDKIDKIGEKGVVNELVVKKFTEEEAKKILELFTVKGTPQEQLAEYEKILPENEGLSELKELFSYLPKDAPVEFSPALARGLAYYTGTIFEGFLKNSDITGSVCGGGRYDKLVGALLDNGKEIAAVGGSFGLEPIMEYLKLRAKGSSGARKTCTEVYVIPIKCYEKSLEIVNTLRESGINVAIDLGDRSISKNLEYANALDIPYVVIIGNQELEQGKVKLKDMRSGEESLLSVEELEEKLNK